MNKSFVKKYFQSLGIALVVLLVVFCGVMGIDFTGGAAKMRASMGTSLTTPGNGGVINVLD